MKAIAIVLLAVLLIVSFVGCAASGWERANSMREFAPPAAMVAARAPEVAGSGYRADIQSGTLTAGSFDDLADPAYYADLARRLLQSDEISSELAAITERMPTVVTLLGSDGRPIGDLPVSVSAGDRTITLRTRTDGRLILTAREATTAAVTLAPQGAAPQPFPLDGGGHTFRLDREGTPPPATLDLVFVIDCTGSMSDELEYLKVELRDMAARTRESFPDVQQRYALICYRDEGDEYVTRIFDFTDSLQTFHGRLGKQSANGGGDYEEAVHKGLAAAGQLRWSDAPAARVLFHIGDAPPHRPDRGAAGRAMDDLKQRGVAIYPVAASGVNPVLEFLMRSAALTTGAQYLFITDDSGVANAHAPPHHQQYDVEILRDLMVRMIATELSGARVPAAEQSIIRRVRPTTQPIDASSPDAPRSDGA